MKETNPAEATPTLNSYQITTFVAVIQQAFYNPEYAADASLNPYEKLHAAIPSEKDVDAMVDYIAELRKRLHGFGNEQTPIEQSEARTGAVVPTLTDRQINVLVLVISRAAISMDFALQFIVDPRPFLVEYSLTDDDLANITEYINYVGYLINKRRGEDWY